MYLMKLTLFCTMNVFDSNAIIHECPEDANEHGDGEHRPDECFVSSLRDSLNGSAAPSKACEELAA
jgi:hypothetical protein